MPRSLPAWVAAGRSRPGASACRSRSIFVVLFASADPIFRRTIADLLGFRIDLGDLPGRCPFALAASWLLGRTALGRGHADCPTSSVPRSARRPARGPIAVARSLGLPEALVILVVVDLVVGAFVGLQLAYLFGGLDTLEAAGMTYANTRGAASSSSSRRPAWLRRSSSARGDGRAPTAAVRRPRSSRSSR